MKFLGERASRRDSTGRERRLLYSKGFSKLGVGHVVCLEFYLFILLWRSASKIGDPRGYERFSQETFFIQILFSLVKIYASSNPILPHMILHPSTCAAVLS